MCTQENAHEERTIQCMADCTLFLLFFRNSSYGSTGEVFGIVGRKPEEFRDQLEEEESALLDGDEDRALILMHQSNAYKELARGTAWYADKIRTVPSLAVRGATEKAYFAGILEKHHIPPPQPASSLAVTSGASSTAAAVPSSRSRKSKKKNTMSNGRGPPISDKTSAASSTMNEDNIDWANMAREWNRHIEDNPRSGL